ncbi:MAG: sensor histidine kinase [Solirubrobacteraceae bacterium]
MRAGLLRTRRFPLAFDVGFAIAMAAITVLSSLAEGAPNRQFDKPAAGQHIPHVEVAAVVIVLVGALALIWRRRAPVRTLAVSLAAAVAFTCLGYVNGAAMLNPVVALYAVAILRTPGEAIGLSVLTAVALMASSAAFDPLGATGGGFILIPGMVAAALFLGLWVAGRHAYARREGEEQARRAVDTERLRIARELHDVVAHTMATINVQAGAAGHVIESQPEQAAQALEAIKRASKEGLRELREILDVLRQADEHEDTAPAPRLAQLGALVQGTERAGLPTTLRVHGDPRPLSPSVELAAYRIVQESLTNALRHAGPATAAVTLSYGAADLRVEVTDDGVGGDGRSVSSADHGGALSVGGVAGHGIVGMRERAFAAGGRLEVGPRPGGGFRVAAQLPLGAP